MNHFIRSVGAFAAVVTLSAPVVAQGVKPLEELTVIGERDQKSLNEVSNTSSRLGLTLRETPATIETMTQAEIQLKGLRTQREAYDSVVGAISGNNPGNPAVVTLRGFGNAAISIMHDGVRVSSATMVTRDTNTWHFEKIEVLKGPSSVLYGEGALAGVINKVTRKPAFTGDQVEALVSYGSFNTLTTAAGANLQVSDTVAFRVDASNLRSDSLYDVDNNESRSSGLTGSVLFKPSSDLSVLLAVDHYDDEYDGTYQGMPMIAREVARNPSDALRSDNGMVLDKSIRHNNYNLDGNYSGARDTTLRARIDYELGDGWSLANDAALYRAKRDFVYIGAQSYTPPTAEFPNGSLARSAQDIVHEHDYASNRLVLSNDSVIDGRRNRFSVGAEYNYSDFTNPRKFSPVGGTALNPIPNADIRNPVLTPYPVDDEVYTTNVVYDSKVGTAAIFVENAFNLTPQWLLVGGVRYENIDLERDITDLNADGALTSGSTDYDPVTWRLGTTYDISPEVAIYGQYTTAVVPASVILIQSIENTRFEMTKGHAYELGFKSSVLEDNLVLTGAVYHIEQEDILSRDPDDFTRVVQGGVQSARGAELALEASLTGQLSLTGGVSYTDAEYDELIEAGGVNRRGNHPINTPSTTVNAGVWYNLADVPLTLGAMARHVSGFYTDTANTYFVRGRTTLDASVSYRLSNQFVLTLRGRNLTDAFYGEYSGYPISNVYIGAPRSLEAALSMKF